MKIKMLIPAKHAVDMEVTKATGTKVHTVKRKIQIYAHKQCEDQGQTLEGSGTVFLVDRDWHITVVPEDTLVAVSFDDAYDAKDFLQDIIEEGEAK